jgi:5-methylcytosine-specific restriction endonuclease McrA
MKCGKHNVVVDIPHSQSLGALVKLNREYNKAQLSKWLTFRNEFLSNSDLICTYCGRDDLIKDQPENIVKQVSNLATVDHVYPVSKGGPRYDVNNCVVSCQKCNQQKADTIL